MAEQLAFGEWRALVGFGRTHCERWTKEVEVWVWKISSARKIKGYVTETSHWKLKPGRDLFEAPGTKHVDVYERYGDTWLVFNEPSTGVDAFDPFVKYNLNAPEIDRLFAFTLDQLLVRLRRIAEAKLEEAEDECERQRYLLKLVDAAPEVFHD